MVSALESRRRAMTGGDESRPSLQKQGRRPSWRRRAEADKTRSLVSSLDAFLSGVAGGPRPANLASTTPRHVDTAPGADPGGRSGTVSPQSTTRRALRRARRGTALITDASAVAAINRAVATSPTARARSTSPRHRRGSGHRGVHGGLVSPSRQRGSRRTSVLDPNAGGDWVWVYHPQHTYMPVRIVSVDKAAGTMQCRDEDGAVITVPHQPVRKIRDVGAINATVPSMAHLPSVTEAAIAFNVERRYGNGQLFTWITPTQLLAVNPCHWNPETYVSQRRTRRSAGPRSSDLHRASVLMVAGAPQLLRRGAEALLGC